MVSLPVMPIDRIPSWEGQIRVMEREWAEIAVRRTRARLADWAPGHGGDATPAGAPRFGRPVGDRAVGLPRCHRPRPSREHAFAHAPLALLDPTGRHGLGCALVRRLLEHCAVNPVPAPLLVREATFSQWRNDREADLVVRGDRFTIVIENKVDAPEQPDQCDDLYENFKDEGRAVVPVPDPGRTQALDSDGAGRATLVQDPLVAGGPGDDGRPR